MTLRSAFYVGHVSHHRTYPKRYSLRHRVYWLLLDLEELPIINDRLRLFSHNRTNLISLQDRDHGDGTGQPLRQHALESLQSAGIDTSNISVRLLCMPRVAGYDFNPLSVYFCSTADNALIAMIYEVNNTFGGRHTYVIPLAERSDGLVHQTCSKEFYVSPFMDLDMAYHFQTRAPDDEVQLSVQAHQGNRSVINTSLHGRKRDLSDLNTLRLAATHPLLPAKVMGAICWHALKLWCSGFAVNRTPPSRANTVTIVRPNE